MWQTTQTKNYDSCKEYDHSTRQHPRSLNNEIVSRQIVVLLHCGCLSLNPFIEISIQNNSSSSDVLNIQASISISPKFESK